MTLSQKNRTHIHQCLVPLLGDEAAEALMAELPANEHDELVTKQFLRAEVAEHRVALEGQIGAVRTEIGELRTDMEKQIGAVRTEIGELRTDMEKQIGGVRIEIGELRTDMERQIGGVRIEIADLRTAVAASSRSTLITMIPTVLAGMAIAARIG